MKITIDNLDGNGALDYTSSLSGAAPLTIERKLNQPSSCTLSVAQASLAVPDENEVQPRQVERQGKHIFHDAIAK